MAKVTIRVEQDNGSNIEMAGNQHGATVVSKEPYTGTGDLLMTTATYIQKLAELASHNPVNKGGK